MMAGAGEMAGDAAGGGLRERKKRETRDALSLAAVRLSAERGWDNVTVDDIAAAANVSVRTFHNYFSSKAEAIVSRHVDRTLRIAEALRLRPAGEPLWAAVAAAVRAEFAPGQEVGTEQAPDPRRLDGIRLMLDEPALKGALFTVSASVQ